MTRKDYVMIADVLAVAWWASSDQRNHIAHDLADALEADNPRFDRARFLTACGVN
jgi:hypothetical protein